MSRSRKYYFLLAIITIAFGLASRSGFTPEFLDAYLGDFLYAVMIFFGVGFLFPKRSTLLVAAIAVGICFAIEISQLIQVDWLDNIRSTRLGKLVLGRGFLWSDLVSYVLGVTTVGLGEWSLSKKEF